MKGIKPPDIKKVQANILELAILMLVSWLLSLSWPTKSGDEFTKAASGVVLATEGMIAFIKLLR